MVKLELKWEYHNLKGYFFFKYILLIFQKLFFLMQRHHILQIVQYVLFYDFLIFFYALQICVFIFLIIISLSSYCIIIICLNLVLNFIAYFLIN